MALSQRNHRQPQAFAIVISLALEIVIAVRTAKVQSHLIALDSHKSVRWNTREACVGDKNVARTYREHLRVVHLASFKGDVPSDYAAP
jgi:hypothetical protein